MSGIGPAAPAAYTDGNTPKGASPMTRDDWQVLVSALTSAISTGDPARTLALLADDAQGAQRREHLRQEWTLLRQAVPDLDWRAEIVHAEGERCIVRWTARGTHCGEYHGLWPSRQAVELTGLAELCACGNRLTDMVCHVAARPLLQLLQAYLPLEGI
jgi:hypothetical protein